MEHEAINKENPQNSVYGPLELQVPGPVIQIQALHHKLTFRTEVHTLLPACLFQVIDSIGIEDGISMTSPSTSLSCCKGRTFFNLMHFLYLN